MLQLEKFRPADSHFVEKFRRSICVDDLTAGSRDVEGAYEFYVKAKLRLAEASFNLRKFESNSSELRQRIQENERKPCRDSSPKSLNESSLSSDDPEQEFDCASGYGGGLKSH